VLEAAVDFAECPLGFNDDGACFTSVGFLIGFDAEHASSSRSVEPVNDAAAGVPEQRHLDTSAGRSERPAEVMSL
jgi:hypothetical protein